MHSNRIVSKGTKQSSNPKTSDTEVYVPVPLKGSTCVPRRLEQKQIVATETTATNRIKAPRPMTRTKLGRLTNFEVDDAAGVDGRFGGPFAGDIAETGAT